ncbi:hypothetical protein JXJ21_15225 [candidate division KSB1 bacterium]|nr:hypothetical protein [candidate division KSB1 bacterium]
MKNKQRPVVEKDLILVTVEEKPAFFGRIEKIVPDVKKNWWQVTFLLLQVPLKVMTWILDDKQIRGEDFTMSGIPLRIERVEVPEEELDKLMQPPLESGASEKEEPPAKSPESEKQARILSMGHKNTD